MGYFAVLSRNLIDGNGKKQENVLLSFDVTHWRLKDAVFWNIFVEIHRHYYLFVHEKNTV